MWKLCHAEWCKEYWMCSLVINICTANVLLDYNILYLLNLFYIQVFFITYENKKWPKKTTYKRSVWLYIPVDKWMRGLCAIYNMCIQVYNVMDLYSRIYSSLNKNLFFFLLFTWKLYLLRMRNSMGSIDIDLFQNNMQLCPK